MTLDELKRLYRAPSAVDYDGDNAVAALFYDGSSADALLVKTMHAMLPKLIAVAEAATRMRDWIDEERSIKPQRLTQVARDELTELECDIMTAVDALDKP